MNIPEAFPNYLEMGNGLAARPQRRVLRLWLAAQRRRGSLEADDTEAELRELCLADGRDPDGSDGEEEEDEEEMDNSEPLEDSDVILSDSGERSQDVPLESADGRMDSNIQLSVCLFFFPHIPQMKIWRVTTRWCQDGGRREG